MTVGALDIEATPPSRCRSQSAPTQSESYEALAPLGLPDPEPHRAEAGGWLNRVFCARLGLAAGWGSEVRLMSAASTA